MRLIEAAGTLKVLKQAQCKVDTPHAHNRVQYEFHRIDENDCIRTFSEYNEYLQTDPGEFSLFSMVAEKILTS